MFLCLAFLISLASASTFLASSPVTNVEVIGADKLAAIEAKSYALRQAWANQIISERCDIIQKTIRLLGSDKCGNKVQTRRISNYKVQAGGFEAVTDPTFLFTLDDQMSTSSIAVLDNTLGFVLSQFGNGRFSRNIAFDDGFTIPYLQVNFAPKISQAQAASFFDLVGTIDYRCWNQSYAGFTQIDEAVRTGLWFLQPDVDTDVFVHALTTACSAWNTLHGNNQCSLPFSQPTDINAAFTQNDWSVDKDGFAFFSAVEAASGSPFSAECIEELEEIRVKALRAALFFASSTTVPRVDACQLVPSHDPHPDNNDNSCARNLACDACLANPRCIFEKVSNGPQSYGVCRPNRKSKESHGHAASVKKNQCSSVSPFPTLTTETLNALVNAANKQCIVTSVSGTNVYVSATVSFTSGIATKDTCGKVIRKVMNDSFRGIKTNLA